MESLNQMQKEIILAIQKIVKANLAKENMNRIVKGIITESLGSDKYNALIDKKIYTIKSHYKHNINDIVRVIVCNGDMSEMYVLY